jgi:hypothetical protein
MTDAQYVSELLDILGPNSLELRQIFPEKMVFLFMSFYSIQR